MSNKWYNHSYDNSGNDNNGIHNSSFDTTFEYNHIFFLSKSLILPVVVNIRDVNVPCSMSRILGSLCRCMTNPPRLQIMALSNVHTCLHTLVGTWGEYHRLESKSIDVLSRRWKRHGIPVAASKKTLPINLFHWPNQAPSYWQIPLDTLVTLLPCPVVPSILYCYFYVLFFKYFLHTFHLVRLCDNPSLLFVWEEAKIWT